MAIAILVVDDDDDFRSIVLDSIDGHFDAVEANSGTNALAAAAQTSFDIALLDVNMPHMDGYELCERLHEISPDLRVVFISGDDTIDARMTAYLAGGDDFIPKPFRSSELLLKLRRLEQVINRASALRDSVKQATDIAMSAMTNAGELGYVLDFTRKLSVSLDIDDLLKALVTATSTAFALQVSAQVRVGDLQKTLDCNGRSSPLEAEMLRRLAVDSQRIFSMNRRLVINYPRITLQVKDMPVDDADRCGRLRDHIALLVDAAENRIDGILLEQAARQHQALSREAMVEMRMIITEIESDYAAQTRTNSALLNKLKTDVDEAMLFIGLTENQEATIMNLILKCSNDATSLYQQGLSISSKFSGLISRLDELNAEAPAQITSQPPRDDDSFILF